PGNQTGLLMYAVGAAFLLPALKEANAPVLFGLGVILTNLFIALVAHLLVAFPTGRLETRAERWLIGALYASTTVLGLAAALFKRSCGCTHPQPRNVFLIVNRPGLADVIEGIAGIVVIVAAAGIAVLLVRRWRSASTPQRRIIAPVLWTGAALVGSLALLVTLQLAGA